MQQGVNDQPEDQPAAELTIVEKCNRRKPGWPGGISLRRLLGAWIIEQSDCTQRVPERKKDDQHDRRKIVRDKNQIGNHRVNENQRGLVHTSCKCLPHPHRERTYPSGFIIVMLVNMLANIDARNTQPIRNASQHNIPKIACISTFDKGHNEVYAANHDGSPDPKNSKLPKSPIFEWIGIREQHNCAKYKQADHCWIEIRAKQGIDTGQRCQDATDQEPADLLRLGEETLRQRMHSVLCAEVIILIQSTGVIGIVVQDVVCTVRNEQAESED